MKTISRVSLAIGLATAGLLFAPTSANAACSGSSQSQMFTYSEFTTAGGQSCQVGDKLYTFTAGDITGSWGGATMFVLDENVADTSIHTFRILPSGGALGAGTYTANYTVAVNGSSEKLAVWGMGSQLSQGTPNYSITTTTTNSADSPVTLPGPGVDVNNNYNTPYLTTANWTNTITVGPGGAVGPDSITNSLKQTPGPLPILGAGAAFGFSRKLRKRIQASA